MNPILVGLVNGCPGEGCEPVKKEFTRFEIFEQIGSLIVLNAGAVGKKIDGEEAPYKYIMPYGP